MIVPYDLHHWERVDGLSYWWCTAPPRTAWRGITCKGCATVITDRDLLESRLPLSPIAATLDVLAYRRILTSLVNP